MMVEDDSTSNFLAMGGAMCKFRFASCTNSTVGFTLIEAVVVSVIIAILAAVAIPNYQSYLMQARQESVNDIADGATALATNYFRKYNQDPTPEKLKIDLDITKYTITIAPPNLTIAETGKSPNLSATRIYK